MSMDDYQIVAIGHPYSPNQRQWQEGYDFNYRSGQYELRMFLHCPSPVEIESVQQGAAQFALTCVPSPAGPLIVVCSRFGVMNWTDTTYSWHLIPKDEQTLPDPDNKGKHALLTTILVDARDGIVRALRACTFSAEFTDALNAAIIHQSQQPFSLTAWEEAVSNLYAHYSTEGLVEMALVRCRGGD